MGRMLKSPLPLAGEGWEGVETDRVSPARRGRPNYYSSCNAIRIASTTASVLAKTSLFQ